MPALCLCGEGSGQYVSQQVWGIRQWPLQTALLITASTTPSHVYFVPLALPLNIFGQGLVQHVLCHVWRVGSFRVVNFDSQSSRLFLVVTSALAIEGPAL